MCVCDCTQDRRVTVNESAHASGSVHKSVDNGSILNLMTIIYCNVWDCYSSIVIVGPIGILGSTAMNQQLLPVVVYGSAIASL